MKIPTREEMRDHIEKALRAQAPGDYARPNNVTDPENGPFLVLRGHQGKEVLFYCDSEVASVEFGPASRHFDFSVEEEEDEDIGGPEGFGENLLGQSMGDSGGDPDEEEDEDEDGEADGDDEEEPAKAGYSAEDLKALLKGIVQATLEITQEKVFAAEYKKGFARVAKFHAPREYEAVKGMKDFKSVSWKGKYTSG